MKITCPFHRKGHRAFNLITAGFALVTLCFLDGCATKYQAPPDSGNNPTIEALAPVWIVSIDGKSVLRIRFTGNQRFAISPDRHVLEFQFSGWESRECQDLYGQRHLVGVRQHSRENLRMSFAPRSGRHYYIHAGVEGAVWKPYINETPPNAFLDLPIH